MHDDMHDDMPQHSAPAADPPARIQVLLIGNELSLLTYREQVLRWADFSTVVFCSPLDEELAGCPCAQVAVLCHTLSVSERRSVAKKLRERCAGIRILALDTHAHPVSEPARYDDVLGNLTGPETLIRRVRQHLLTA